MVSVELGLKDRCAFQNVPLLPCPPHPPWTLQLEVFFRVM
jgi:hypothetical protein